MSPCTFIPSSIHLCKCSIVADTSFVLSAKHGHCQNFLPFDSIVCFLSTNTRLFYFRYMYLILCWVMFINISFDRFLCCFIVLCEFTVLWAWIVNVDFKYDIYRNRFIKRLRNVCVCFCFCWTSKITRTLLK